MALTVEQQNRLTELKAKRQQLLLVQQGQQANDANLIGQLKGRLSTFEPLDIQRGQPRTGTTIQQLQPDPRFMTPRQRLEELKRRKAELELIQGGKTREQIQFVLDVNKNLVPSTVGRTAGGIAGAIATPLALNLIPGFAAFPEEVVTIPMALMKTARTIAPILGAGLGGGLGEAAQTGIEEKRLIGKETFLKAFGKEAAFEAGGRSFVRGMKFAFSPFIKQAIPEAADVITEFSKVGGVLTPSQLDSRMSLSIADEIVRGGFATKQIFQDLGEKTGRAALVYTDTLLDRMAGGIARLGNEQLGREFAEGITRPNGKVFQMLDDLFDPLYGQIDELTKGGVVGAKRAVGEVPDVVQRFQEKGVSATLNKPQGLFTSPADIISPQQEVGAKKLLFNVNKNADILTVDSSGLVRTNRGLVGKSGGVATLQELLGTAETQRILNLPRNQLLKELSQKHPNVNWSRFVDTQEMAEGLAGVTAKQRGFDAVWAPDKTAPEFSEFIALTKKAIPSQAKETARFFGATVGTKDITSFAKKQLALDKRLNGLFLSDAGRSKFTKAAGLPQRISFGDIRTLRSSFLKDVRKFARDADTNEGLIKQLSKITDDVMRKPDSAKGLNPQAQNLLNNTNRLYATAQKGLQETFPEQLGKRLIKNPSSVTKELFPQNNPKAIRNLRLSLTEPISGKKSAEGTRQWLQLRTAWFADAIGGPQGAVRGDVVKPAIFESSLRRMGKDAIKEMLPDANGKKQLQTIRNLLKAMSKKPEGGASLFIRGGQVGGLFMMYNGTKDGDWLQVSVGGALVVGPYFFAKMAAHPLGSRLLAIGIKLKPGSTSLVPITARLVNLSRQLDIQEIRNQIAAQRGKKVARARPAVPALGQQRGFGGRGF